jgi:hypothetical protein
LHALPAPDGHGRRGLGQGRARKLPGGRGEELIRDYDPGDGGFLKSFCSACGGALYSSHPEHPGVLGIRLGTVDGDPGIRPGYHQRVETAALWEALPDDGLPRYEGPAPDARE